MDHKTKPQPKNSRPADWTELKSLCKKIENLSPIPFRLIDAQNQLIFQSVRTLDPKSTSLLTMHCRYRGKTLFRILCAVEENESQKALGLMFALKKIGMDYTMASLKRESLYQEIYRDHKFLHFFYTLPENLTKELTRNQLCHVSLNRICHTLNVGRGSLFFFNSKTKDFQLVALYGKRLVRPELAKLNAKIFEWVRERKRPLLIENVDRYPAFKGKGIYKTRSFLSAPIYDHPSVSQKRLAGVINLADPIDRDCFSSHDLKFVASAVGYAIFLAMTKPAVT